MYPVIFSSLWTCLRSNTCSIASAARKTCTTSNLYNVSWTWSTKSFSSVLNFFLVCDAKKNLNSEIWILTHLIFDLHKKYLTVVLVMVRFETRRQKNGMTNACTVWFGPRPPVQAENHAVVMFFSGHSWRKYVATLTISLVNEIYIYSNEFLHSPCFDWQILLLIRTRRVL